MKITFLLSGSIRSNFSYRALALARSLRIRGHDVSIVAPKADKYNNFIPEEISSIDGVKIIQPFQFKTKRLEINLLPYILHCAYIMIKHKSDLIYIYKPTPISIVGLFGKLFYRTETVLDMDDLGSEVMKIEGHPSYQIKLVQWCEDLAAKYSDKIVAASHYLKDHFTKKFPWKPILVIPNGVDTGWFEPITFSEDKKKIVFMGSLNRKSILEPLFDVLPHILKKIPDVKVLIIGDGKYLPYFKRKVTELALDSSVEFTGWLTLSEAQTRLKAGDIGYNYTPDEMTTRAASNMKVPQYMSRGVVPLVSQVGDLPSYVDFGKAGYICEPDDSRALEEGIINALNDADRAQKAQNASIFSQSTFNWDKLSEKFEQWVNNRTSTYLNENQEMENKKKTIYFVTISVPGDVGGGEIRNFHMVNQWAKLPNTHVEVFGVSSNDPAIDEQTLESQISLKAHVVKESPRTIFRTIKSVVWDRMPPFMNDFKASGVGDIFREACEKKLPDVVQLEQIHAYYVIRKHIPWLQSKGVKIVLDCHNIEFEAFNESLDIFSLPKKIIGKYLVSTYRKLEIEGAKKSTVILCCSDIDADFFKKYNKNTHVVPNGVDTRKFEQSRDTFNPTIIFMGGVAYPPNEDAIKFYLSEIHPIIKKQIPTVKFLAIGTEKSWLDSRGLSDSTVHGLGFVPEVEPYLKEASIGICPIRYGSGTRLKILTYMAASLPVVSTTKGAEGVDYVIGRDILMEDEPALFAQAVLKLLQNKSFAHQMGKSGHDFVLEHYDWDVIGKNLRTIVYDEKN